MERNLTHMDFPPGQLRFRTDPCGHLPPHGVRRTGRLRARHGEEEGRGEGLRPSFKNSSSEQYPAKYGSEKSFPPWFCRHEHDSVADCWRHI